MFAICLEDGTVYDWQNAFEDAIDILEFNDHKAEGDYITYAN